jgi:hypothetical protein
VEITCPHKSSYSGTLWLTKENIPMRIETADKSGSGKKVFRMELKNLKIAKQDPRLFDVPSGYEKFEIPAMGEMDIQKMMKDRAQPAPPPAKPSRPADTGRSYTSQKRGDGSAGVASSAASGGSGGGQTGEVGRTDGTQAGGAGAAASTGSQPQPVGRSYSAQPREKSAIDQVLDPAKKIKSLFRW